MPEKRWFWATLTLSSITIISVVLAAWELVEKRLFRDADYITLHYLYVTRGIASALLLAFWAAWFVLRQRRKSEADLRRSRDLYRGLLEAFPGAVILYDSELRILEWNAPAERMYGYTREEILGARLPILPADESRRTRRLPPPRAVWRTRTRCRNPAPAQRRRAVRGPTQLAAFSRRARPSVLPRSHQRHPRARALAPAHDRNRKAHQHGEDGRRHGPSPEFAARRAAHPHRVDPPALHRTGLRCRSGAHRRGTTLLPPLRAAAARFHPRDAGGKGAAGSRHRHRIHRRFLPARHSLAPGQPHRGYFGRTADNMSSPTATCSRPCCSLS